MNPIKLALNQIIRNESQPRKIFDQASIAELAESIMKDGLQSPILVRPLNGKYEIVQGERRCRAAEIAGLTEIDAFVKELADDDAFHLAVIENIQREQLSPIEEANAFKRYVEMGYTHEEIAKKVSKSRTYVTSRLRLLSLSSEVQDWIADGRLSEGHAKKLLTARNDLCRLMDLCYFVHGTENSFEYVQRLFMYSFKDKKKISVVDVDDFLSRFKYLLIRSELYWLSFLAFPEELKAREAVQKFALQSVTIALEMGANYSKFEIDDVKFMFEYAIKHKKPDEKAWEIYKAMEEWECFMRKNSFKELEQDEIVELLKKYDLPTELDVF